MNKYLEKANIHLRDVLNKVTRKEQNFLDYLKDLTNQEKGDIFEYLCYYVLKRHPIYKNKFKKIYLEKDIPYLLRNELKLPDRDKGIDLLAIDYNGKIYGIQSKFRSDEYSIIPWGELATFPGLCHSCKLDVGIMMTNCYEICNELKTEQFQNICGEFFKKLNDSFYQELLEYLETFEEPEKIFFNPLPHQNPIINSAYKHFVLDGCDRGQIQMACGTGKTLTSKFIVEECGYKKIIVAVPSLMLLSQYFQEWNEQTDNMKTILIGSDIDDEVKHLDLILTTDKELVKKWLTDNENTNGMRVVFTTYQSGVIIKKSLKEVEQIFDMIIYDEAHKTTGVEGSLFTSLLDNDLMVSKRLFQTATPKVYNGDREDIFSMDDENVYGKVIYELTLRTAIDLKLLTDYQIITPITNKSVIQDIMTNDGKILLNGDNEYSTKSIISAVLILKSITKNNTIKKILTYHPTASKGKNSAKKFVDLLKKFAIMFNMDICALYLDGQFSMKKRKKVLNTFEKSQKITIICSARVLNEGISIKCIDTICFVTPRKSIIDIIQCIGRALRLWNLNPDKIANIILPIIIGNEDIADNSLTDFDTIWYILRALMTQDKTLSQSFIDKTTLGGSSSSKMNEILQVEMPVKIDIKEWFSGISEKIWKNVDRFNFMANQVYEWVSLNHKIPSHNEKKDKEENKLGIWCKNQRKVYREGKLEEVQYTLLENIKKWYWNDKLMSMSTSVRNPERLGGYLKLLKLFEGEKYNKDIQKLIYKQMVKNKLWNANKKFTDEEKVIYNSERNFTNEEVDEFYKRIVKDKTGPDTRTRTWYSPLFQLEFVKGDKDTPICITELGNRYINENFKPSIFKESLSSNPKFEIGYDKESMIKITEHVFSSFNRPISKKEFGIFVIILPYYDFDNINETISEYEKSSNKEKWIKNNICPTKSNSKSLKDYIDVIIRYLTLADMIISTKIDKKINLKLI